MLFVLPTRTPGMGGPEEPREAFWRGKLSAEVAKRGVKTYFAAGHFAHRGEPDVLYHDNVHLRPAGHHVYAEFITATILSDSERMKQWSGRRAP